VDVQDCSVTGRARHRDGSAERLDPVFDADDARAAAGVGGADAVVDPALVQELVTARRRHDRWMLASGREREVLALMAEGRSNAGIARQLAEQRRGGAVMILISTYPQADFADLIDESPAAGFLPK
jgi:hypothetical protein